MATGSAAPDSPLLSTIFCARNTADSIAYVSMVISAIAPMISCWSWIPCMYFCVAEPAANKPSFLACATSFRSSVNAPSSSSPIDGPESTSSISFLMAGMSGNWPVMARFNRNPVMISRLISFVPSKMRLMRASR